MNTKHDRGQAGPAGEDPALVRAWRQASDEQPSAQLDAAILAAARRSVREDEPVAKVVPVPPRVRSRWMQWQPLAAAATVAGLAFVLVPTLPREREVAPPIRIQVPGPAPSAEREVGPPARGGAPPSAPAPAVPLESQGDPRTPVVTEAPAGGEAEPPLRERGTAGAAVPPPAEAAPDAADATRRAETDQRKGVMTDAAGEAYSQEAAAPAEGRTVTRDLGTATAPSTTDWAARIEALHASGDLVGAAAALREFRSVDPEADARLPESLQEWARTVE